MSIPSSDRVRIGLSIIKLIYNSITTDRPTTVEGSLDSSLTTESN